MTTESMQPQTELGLAPATGQGQQQGHRRRRRRRKNKSSQAIAPQAQPPQAAEPQFQAPPPTPRPQPVKHKPASTHQAAHPSPGRKKKFFQKGSPTAAQPGNSFAAPPQGKRKSRQKGAREFVGPMDHSYRAVNGNTADGPPSTIQISGNGHGGAYYQDIYEPRPAAAVRENAPTRIFCFIEDLFFMAKIQETARKLGVKVEFAKGDKETLARLTDGSEVERPKLLVFDLNNLNAKPMSLIPKFKSKLKKATSIVGFLNHLQGELKAKAIEAGCDTVMPRSAFSQSLPNLLRRYGMEEEDEYAPQPV
ncbi:MAG: response regulator [Terracidiphilus sp.]